MKNRAKELIADGKEKEAKKLLQEATRLKKQLEVIFDKFRVLRTGKKYYNNKDSMLRPTKLTHK